MSSLRLIPVTSLREFPAGALWGFTAKTVEEVRVWALKRGANQVWYFVNEIGRFGITAAVRALEVTR